MDLLQTVHEVEISGESVAGVSPVAERAGRRKILRDPVSQAGVDGIAG